MFFYFAVFRLLRLSSMLIKVVATLGVSVTLPALCTIIFGNQAVLKAPGLAPEPVRVFKFLGVPVTMDQIIVYVCVMVIVVVGAVVLRYTDVGLRVRAMVDSPAMTSLSGTSPNAMSIGVWAVSIGLAGLVGVLSAPIIGLDPSDFTLLMVAAFAAVVAAKLRSLPVAVAVGLGMGIAGALVQYWLPPSSSFTAAVLPSIPFVVTAIFLVYFMIRSGGVDESAGVGGALDRAIAPQGEARIAASTSDDPAAGRSVGEPGSSGSPLSAPAVHPPQVLGGSCRPGRLLRDHLPLLHRGDRRRRDDLALPGHLCRRRRVHHGHPRGKPWLAGAARRVRGRPGRHAVRGDDRFPHHPVGGPVCGPGHPHLRIVGRESGVQPPDLPEQRHRHQRHPAPVRLGTRAFVYLSLAVFAVVALIVVNLRRSTTGMALNAVRWSEPGSKTLGISVLQMKVLVAGLAAFVAGIGGAMLALSLGVALSANYATLTGVIWLAVLVTLGIRSNVAALFAGLSYTLLPGIAGLPAEAWGNVPPVLFGLGAIAVAKYPDGTFAMQARQIRWVWTKVARRGGLAGAPRNRRSRARAQARADHGGHRRRRGGRIPTDERTVNDHPPMTVADVLDRRSRASAVPGAPWAKDVSVRFGGLQHSPT